MSSCPACHKYIESDTVIECPFCFIVFKKWKARGTLNTPSRPSANVLNPKNGFKKFLFIFLVLIPSVLLITQLVCALLGPLLDRPDTDAFAIGIFLAILAPILTVLVLLYAIPFVFYGGIPSMLFPSFFIHPAGLPIGILGGLVFIIFYLALYFGILKISDYFRSE
jgi:hypothetical protein